MTVRLKNRKQMIACRDRRREIERLLVERPDLSQARMAEMFGVTQKTVSVAVKVIQEEWLRTDVDTAKRRRRLRVRQCEAAMARAMADYTDGKFQPCGECGGKGDRWEKGKRKARVRRPCGACSGEGKVCVRPPGDPALLRLVMNGIAECAKLENLYPREKREHLLKGVMRHAHLHGHVDLTGLSDDALMKAMAVLDGLKGDGANGRGRVVDGHIVSSKFVEDLGTTEAEGGG